MPQSLPSAQAPILKGAWSDAEKLALLVSMIRSAGAPKWSNGIAVPEGRTLQACAKMYSELLKASASVKMTQGTAITPSGTRPRGSGAVKDFDGDTPIKKRKAAASKTSKNPSKKAKKSFPVARFDEVGDDDQDDESVDGGDGEEEKKVVVKLEAKAEEEQAFGEDAV